METAITVDQRSAGVKVLQAAPPNRRPDKTRFKTKVEKKQASMPKVFSTRPVWEERCTSFEQKKLSSRRAILRSRSCIFRKAV
jgi:hypothetical protein